MKNSKDDVSLPGVDVRGQRNQFKIEEPSLYKLPDSIKDTPQSITVLPEQMLEERALFTLRDALRNVPGISLAAGEGGGAPGRQPHPARLPGAATTSIIDGVRDLGQYTRDTFNLESVEVLKGPSSVLFGRGSTGGIINQVSKAPKLTPFYELSGTVRHGPQGRVTVDVNQPIGAIGGAAPQPDGLQGRRRRAATTSTQQRWGVAPSLRHRAQRPDAVHRELLLPERRQHARLRLPVSLRQAGAGGRPVRRENFYGMPDRDYEHDDVHIGTLRFEHDVQRERRAAQHAALAMIDRGLARAPSRPSRARPRRGTPLGAIQVSRTGTQRSQQDTQRHQHHRRASSKFNTWRFKHTLVAGVEAPARRPTSQRYTFTGVPERRASSTRTPLPNLAGMGRRQELQRLDVERTAVGVYAVDEMAITDQWKIMGGLRYDHFDADFRNTLRGPEVLARPTRR